MYAVAQDIFWWMDGEQDVGSREMLLNLEDPYVQDMDKLIESRKNILKLADWIIP